MLGQLREMFQMFGSRIDPDQELIQTVANRQKSLDISSTDTDTGYGLDIESYNLMSELMGSVDSRIAKYKLYEHMDERYPDISYALDLYADETIIQDVNEGVPFWVASDNKSLVDLAQGLLYDQLNLKDGQFLNTLVRNLCKYGDSFSEIVVDDLGGVVKLKELPVKSMNVHFDVRGTIHAYYQMFRGSAIGTSKLMFEPWQIEHMMLPNKTTGNMYGGSVLMDSIVPVKMLEAVELAVMLSRLNSSVDRYIFKIPVGTKSKQEAQRYINEVKGQIRRKRVINTENGQFTSVNDILTALEDLFIPVREGGSIEIDKLEKRNSLSNQIDDLEFFDKKEKMSLKMPSQFINTEEVMEGKSLAGTDLRYARKIQKIQNVVRKYLHSVVSTHVRYLWWDRPEPFNIILSSVSQLEEQLALENLEMRYNLVGTMQDFLPTKKLYTDILKFSDEEAEELLKALEKQKRNDKVQEAMADAEADKAVRTFNDKNGIPQEEDLVSEFRRQIRINPRIRQAVENTLEVGRQYLDTVKTGKVKEEPKSFYMPSKDSDTSS